MFAKDYGPYGMPMTAARIPSGEGAGSNTVSSRHPACIFFHGQRKHICRSSELYGMPMTAACIPRAEVPGQTLSARGTPHAVSSVGSVRRTDCRTCGKAPIGSLR